MYENSVVRLPDKTKLVYSERNENLDEKNSLMSISYELGENKNQRVALDWVVKFLKQKYFKEMRTEKQLGYIVFFSLNFQRGVYGVNFLI